MKTKTLCKNLDKFVKDLGDENLTASVAICEGKYYLSVSCHSSEKFVFAHGGLQRTAEIDELDMDDNFNVVLNGLVDKYKECLILRDNTNTENIEDAIERIKTVSS